MVLPARLPAPLGARLDARVEDGALRRQTTAARRRVCAWLGGASIMAITACRTDPAYTLPVVESPPRRVRTVVATPGTTLDLGSDASDVCVLRSVERWWGGLAAADAATDEATAPVADVKLYIDRTRGTWQLAAYGAVTATVGCVAWSAFGGPPAITQIDNGGGAGQSGDDAAAIAPTGGARDCVLSDIQGDFGPPDNGAQLDGAALIVTNANGDGIYASATCFGGDADATPIPFTDYPIDARGGTMRVEVMGDEDGLCGMSRLAAMSAPDSSVSVTDGAAIAVHAVATVRCFAYTASDAH